MEQVTKPPDSEEKRHDNAYSEKALRTLWLLILAGVIGVVLFALQAPSLREFFSATAVGVMVSGASLLIGGFLGFLFGIPRTLQQERPVEMPGGPVGFRQEGGDQFANYRANTNLEQISDWLTKILVGVGLTQLNKIPTALTQVGQSVSAGFGQANITPVFVLSTILYFLICGFLFGYLWTRLFLPGAFRQADLSVLASQVREARTEAKQAASEAKQANDKLSKMKQLIENDNIAMIMVSQQLSPSKDVPAPTQEELNDAIKNASSHGREQIFILAHDFRSANWRDDNAKMELTIPIFRALIENDVDGQHHRYHAQLGYALKDKPGPDNAQAQAELTKAIEIRGSWKEKGWVFYEFVRAICRIRQDEACVAGRPSSPEVREAIFQDLYAGAQADFSLGLMQKDPDIKKWMSLNGVTFKDFK